LAKLFKLISAPAALATAVAAGAGAGWLVSALLISRVPVEPPPHAGLTIERLSEVSQLLTLKIDLADALLCRIDGYAGGIQAALLIKGDVSIGVDLAEAHFENVDDLHRTASLILPAPRASQARLDHNRTRLVALQPTGLWSISPGTRAHEAIVNQAMREGQALLVAAANAKDADDRARDHAQTVLSAFCRPLGWRICVQWADRAAGSDKSTLTFTARSG
jgi:hypothetical protein